MCVLRLCHIAREARPIETSRTQAPTPYRQHFHFKFQTYNLIEIKVSSLFEKEIVFQCALSRICGIFN